MNAPMTALEIEVADHIEDLPAPDGFEWCAVSDEQYEKACADRSLPTAYVEYFDGDHVTMRYLVGQHDLAPAVTR
ncbi:hypothetical protein GCM10009722_35270 [Williamsia deligens]|nr:hypothetical protein [Williamsia deligens]